MRISLEFLLSKRSIAGLCVFIALASASYLAAVFGAGRQETFEALARIGGFALTAGCIACAASLLLRCLRWWALLHWLDQPLRWRDTIHVYLAGLAVSATPGKVGETLRSALLARHGMPIRRSLAAFLADRGSDVIGLALLGALAGWYSGERQRPLEWIALAGVLVAWSGFVLARQAWLRRRLLAGTGRWTEVFSWAAGMGDAWAALWFGWRPLACITLAMVAYGLQGLIFAVYLQVAGVGLPVATCMAMFANAVLIGAASLLPGGLGAMETALILQLRDRDLSWANAVAAVLTLRVATLWFAWAVGLCALVAVSRAQEVRGLSRLATDSVGK